MNWLKRIKRILSVNNVEHEELSNAEYSAAATKVVLDDTIAQAEKISRVVELKAVRDMRRANALVESTNQAIRIINKAKAKVS